MSLRDQLTFGFEQTFTVGDWWTESGFVSTSDTPLKRAKMKAMADEFAPLLNGKVVESLDIYNHLQYEVTDASGVTQFYVTMDPGSIEVKTPPCLLKDVERVNAPMFEAAERAGLVAYRNWWYGVKGGTEGGCHVNMGGFTAATNPLRQRPEIVVRYFAWLHNHPEFHYPFMGLDTGPGGNAQRMDEHETINALAPIEELLSTPALAANQVREALKETTLVKEKSSMPSLTKFKGPDYLLEDRGQEAVRSARELFLVCDWRMRLFEQLQNHCPQLEHFPQGHWHGHRLSSAYLWQRFLETAKTLGLDPASYQVFFERQFPALRAGQNIPQAFALHEGRRPRVITDVQKRNDIVISKTIDTRHKRLELHIPLTGQWSATYGAVALALNWHEISQIGRYAVIDLFVQDKDAVVEFSQDAQVVGRFSPFNMMWV